MKTLVVSKSDFIRSQPADMPVNEVIEKGKEAKLRITPSLVYGVRSHQKKVVKAPAANGNGHAAWTPNKAEAALIALASEIGLSKAAEILAKQQEVVTRLLS